MLLYMYINKTKSDAFQNFTTFGLSSHSKHKIQLKFKAKKNDITVEHLTVFNVIQLKVFICVAVTAAKAS